MGSSAFWVAHALDSARNEFDSMSSTEEANACMAPTEHCFDRSAGLFGLHRWPTVGRTFFGVELRPLSRPAFVTESVAPRLKCEIGYTLPAR